MQREVGGLVAPTQSATARAPPRRERSAPSSPAMAAALAPMSGETPAHDPLSQVVPGKEDMGDEGHKSADDLEILLNELTKAGKNAD